MSDSDVARSPTQNLRPTSIGRMVCAAVAHRSQQAGSQTSHSLCNPPHCTHRLVGFRTRPDVENLLNELKHYVDFDPADADALRAFGQASQAYVPAISDIFYAKVDANPETRSAIRAPEQRVHLKTALCAWLEQLLLGPWDNAYYERRAQLGKTHVAVHIPARHMLAAMSVIRSQLLVLADAYASDASERTRLSLALHRLLDLELAVMLEAYELH